MSSNEFSLVGLVPKPLIFRDAEGRPHPMKTRRQLDLANLVEIGEMLQLVQTTLGRMADLRAAADDGAKIAALHQVADEVDYTLNQVLRTLIPSVEGDAWELVGHQDKWALIEWWNAQQPPLTPGERAAVQAAGAPTPPSRPSPASSVRTGRGSSRPRSGLSKSS